MNPEGDQCLCMVRELDFNGTSGIYWDKYVEINSPLFFTVII